MLRIATLMLGCLLAAAPTTIEAGMTLVAREWRTDIGPVDLLCRDADGRAVAVEVKRRAIRQPAAINIGLAFRAAMKFSQGMGEPPITQELLVAGKGMQLVK